jgi:subtilisin family serine protease
MALPRQGGIKAREMAAAVRGLKGVISAVADPLLQIADTIPPMDPFYVDDLDPGSDCDIVTDPGCTAEDLVDQWGLFQVEAESAWLVQTGSPEVIIAVLDSGIDLDHDDLWDNIWTNSAEMAGADGIDDDGNGKIDDKRGYDFAGNNVGSPSDDPLSEDANPDVFYMAEHQWIQDGSAIPFGWRFDGDAAVGDGIDNNLEYYPLFYTINIVAFHGTAVARVIGMMANNINPETSAGEGMVGACWHCKIMNVRTINAEGEALDSDMVEAIH